MDTGGETDLEKAKRLHLIRQTIAKNKDRGPGGKFIKKDSEQIVVDRSTASSKVASAVKQNVSVSEDKSKPTISGDDAPLVDVKVTNPIAYFKKWWKKVIEAISKPIGFEACAASGI